MKSKRQNKKSSTTDTTKNSSVHTLNDNDNAFFESSIKLPWTHH